MTAQAFAPTRMAFVDVRLEPEARLVVSLVTGSAHPLCPLGIIVGPLTLDATPDLPVSEPFGDQVFERVESALNRMGHRRSGPWEVREHGFVAWFDTDSALWPLSNSDAVLDLIMAGILP